MRQSCQDAKSSRSRQLDLVAEYQVSPYDLVSGLPYSRGVFAMQTPDLPMQRTEAQTTTKGKQVGWHLLKLSLLAGATALSTWGFHSIHGMLLSSASNATPEPVTLAIFGAVLISFGMFLRRRLSQNDSARSDRVRGHS